MTMRLEIDKYGNRYFINGIYTMEEIFGRIYFCLNQMRPLCGYPYSLRVDADNATEPPYLTLNIFNMDWDRKCSIFELVVDQNTRIDDFEYWMKELCRCINVINRAYDEKITYNEALKLIAKEEEEQNKNLPF